MNLAKLDSMIFSGILLPLSIISILLIASWLMNPIVLTSGVPTLIVEALFACFFVGLPAYSFAYVSDRLHVRVTVIRGFILYAMITILLGGFLVVEWIDDSLMAALISYKVWFQALKYASFVAYPILMLVMIGLLYAFVSRALGHWLISQIPKKSAKERINFDNLFRPLPVTLSLIPKIGMAVATGEMVLITVIWAFGLRLMIGYGALGVLSLLGWCIFATLTFLLTFRSRRVYKFIVHTTARRKGLQDTELREY
jgi:hypothetical protein